MTLKMNSRLYTFYMMSIICQLLIGDSNANASTVRNDKVRQNRDTCTPSVKFKLCKPDDSANNPMWKMQNSLRYTFRLLIKPQCTHSAFEITWTLLDKDTGEVTKTFEKFQNKFVLKLEPYSLDFGRYILKAEVRESADLQVTGKATALCWIRAVTRSPIPHIKGGSSRTLPTGFEATLDAAGSIESGIKDLRYSWSCRSQPKTTECENLYKKRDKTITMKITAKAGGTYVIELMVKSSGISKTVEQVIKVGDENTPVIEIKCVKNCIEDGRFYTDPAVPLFVRVVCLSNCGIIGEYYWDISSGPTSEIEGGFIVASGAEYGREEERLIIKSGLFSYNATYDLIADANAKPYKKLATSILEIATTLNAALKINCSVEPLEGWSMQTDFHIKCNTPDHPRPLSYQIKQLSGDRIQDTTIAFSSIPDFTLKLSAESNAAQTLHIVMIDDTMVSAQQNLTVNIKSLLANITSDKEKLKEIRDIYDGEKTWTDSVRTLLKLGELEEAVQITNGLQAELKRIPESEETEQFVTNFEVELMNDLVDAFVVSSDEIEAVVTLLPKLTSGKDKPKDIRHSTLKAKLCKTLAYAIEANLKSTSHPYIYHKTVEEYAKNLQECAEDILDSNYKTPTGFNTTTPSAIGDHVVIDEDYPNYSDVLDKSSREDLKEMTNDAIETLESIGLAFSRAIARGEPPTKVGKKSEMSLDVEYADLIVKKTFERSGVSVKFPDTLGVDKEEEVRVVFTSFNKDAFFWDDSANGINTPIIKLNVYGEKNKEISKLSNPIDSSFNVTDTNTTVFTVGLVTVPKNMKEWVSGTIDYNMTVYRLDVTNGSSLMIIFNDISPVKEMLVVVQKFRRPTLSDFAKAKVARDNTTISTPTVHEDCWYYVAVLPKKVDVINSTTEDDANFLKLSPKASVSENFTVSYRYSFVSQKCLEWKNKKWNVANCVVSQGTTTNNIHCQCKTITTLAAQMDAMPYKVDAVKTVTLRLTPVVSYVVYSSTLLVFLLYCLALCFVIQRVKIHTNLYFLGDNVKDERYAYLLAIQTGKQHGSGTTANVTIKLYGSKDNSKAHVLNYPDPDKKILQRGNEDLFIMTTERHLGDVTRLQLWYDSIGLRPSWYCESVTVFDLQSEQQWFFEVEELFTMLKENKNRFDFEHKIKQTEVDRKRGRFMRFYFGAEHTWNVLDGLDDLIFPYTERITVLLSNVYCTYALSLWICANPSMRLSDSLGMNYFTDYKYLIAYSLSVSVLAFIPNITFTVLFRHSQRSHFFTQITTKTMFLPERTRIVTWVLLILTIVVTTTYLMVFGFWMGLIPSLVWLTVTTIALLVNILVLESVFHALFNTAQNLLGKDALISVSYNFKEIIEEAEKQRQRLYGCLGEYSLRPYLKHLYRPLTEAKLIERRRIATKRTEIRRTLTDMIYFCMYIFLLYFLLYVNMDSMSAISNDHMEDMLKSAQFTGTIGTQDVQSLDDIYNYINDTLIGVLHPQTWYGDWHAHDPGLMIDFNTKVIGVARIRQKKVIRNSCPLSPIMKMLNVTECNPDYSRRYSDRSRRDQDESMWTFQSASKSKTFYLIMGELYTYSGSGFIAKLGRNLNNAYYMSQLLKDYGWLNPLTRVVLVEFLAYNANQNLFSAVTIVFERSSTQKIIAHTSIFTARLAFTQTKLQLFIVIAFTVFVMLIVQQATKYTIRLIKYGPKYLANFWNILEFLIVIMNIVVIILFLLKTQEFDELMLSLATKKHTEFVNYFHVVYLHNINTILIAVLVFIAILRMWRFLRFIMIFRVFEKTIMTGFKPLIAALIYHATVIFMFGLSGHIMFCFFSHHYRNIERTFVTLMQLSINMAPYFNFRLIKTYFPRMGVLYYCLFLLCIYSVINLYIIVVRMYYDESKNYFSNLILPYSVKDYIKDEWDYLTESWRRHFPNFYRLRAGQDCVLPENEIVCPKSTEERYANCILMTDKKLQTMALVARGVIRTLYGTKSHLAHSKMEVDLMKDVVLNTVANKSDRITSRTIFFKACDKSGVKFVTDNKLQQMEYVVRSLLAMPRNDDDITINEEKVTMKDKNTLERIVLIETALESMNKIIGNINVVLQRKPKKRRFV